MAKKITEMHLIRANDRNKFLIEKSRLRGNGEGGTFAENQ